MKRPAPTIRSISSAAAELGVRRWELSVMLRSHKIPTTLLGRTLALDPGAFERARKVVEVFKATPSAWTA